MTNIKRPSLRNIRISLQVVGGIGIAFSVLTNIANGYGAVGVSPYAILVIIGISIALLLVSIGTSVVTVRRKQANETPLPIVTETR